MRSRSFQPLGIHLKQLQKYGIVTVLVATCFLYQSICYLIDYLFRISPEFVKIYLNKLYVNSSLLQAYFSYQLNCQFHEADDDKKSSKHLASFNRLKLIEYSIYTDDGYELGLQRVVRIDEDDNYASVYQSEPVLLFHGFLQSSDSFLCGTSSLVSYLISAGYDVWLANNRGNKYSSRHRKYSLNHEKFWDFSIDDLARFDFPALVNGVLIKSGKSKLSLIGFSQGSAQASAGLTIYPQLCAQVTVFIALSPAVRAPAVVPPLLASLAYLDERELFYLLGRKAVLESANLSRRVLSQRAFAWIVSIAMRFLFGWTCNNISRERRIKLFQYVYSTSSSKNLIHWFQIIKRGNLCGFNKPPRQNYSSFFFGARKRFAKFSKVAVPKDSNMQFKEASTEMSAERQEDSCHVPAEIKPAMTSDFQKSPLKSPQKASRLMAYLDENAVPPASKSPSSSPSKSLKSSKLNKSDAACALPPLNFCYSSDQSQKFSSRPKVRNSFSGLPSKLTGDESFACTMSKRRQDWAFNQNLKGRTSNENIKGISESDVRLENNLLVSLVEKDACNDPRQELQCSVELPFDSLELEPLSFSQPFPVDTLYPDCQTSSQTSSSSPPSDPCAVGASITSPNAPNVTPNMMEGSGVPFMESSGATVGFRQPFATSRPSTPLRVVQTRGIEQKRLESVGEIQGVAINLEHSQSSLTRESQCINEYQGNTSFFFQLIQSTFLLFVTTLSEVFAHLFPRREHRNIVEIFADFVVDNFCEAYSAKIHFWEFLNLCGDLCSLFFPLVTSEENIVEVLMSIVFDDGRPLQKYRIPRSKLAPSYLNYCHSSPAAAAPLTRSKFGRTLHSQKLFANRGGIHVARDVPSRKRASFPIVPKLTSRCCPPPYKNLYVISGCFNGSIFMHATSPIQTKWMI